MEGIVHVKHYVLIRDRLIVLILIEVDVSTMLMGCRKVAEVRGYKCYKEIDSFLVIQRSWCKSS